MRIFTIKRLTIYSLQLIVICLLASSFVSCGPRESAGPSKVSEEEILYYTCGMHPSVRVSPQEYAKGKVNCPICNMKLVPVYKEKAEEIAGGRKILFYRHPMNPAITSKGPAKDDMGMDYIPVYEETEEDAAYYGCGMEGEEHVFLIKGVKGMTCPICGMPLKELSKEEADRLKGVVSRIKIKKDQIVRSGVQTESVRKLHIYKEVRTVGRVAYDPQLAIAEEEFVSTLKALDKIKESQIIEIKERTQNLVESSKRRLTLLGLSQEQIEDLGETREIHSSLILPEEKMWIYGDAYEYELSWVKIGEKVKVTTSSLPGEVFDGVISSVNPVVDPRTRSVRFRAQVDNPGLELKPQMYVDVTIQSMYVSPRGEQMVLAIAKDAVLDTGIRKIVWVDRGSGEYEGRSIVIGPEATAVIEDRELRVYPILSGLDEGDMVVTKANFLIDSQSQISGVAASAYGGALGAKEESGESKGSQMHMH